MPRHPEPGSLRSEAARRGVSLWQVRKERAAQRGVDPRRVGAEQAGEAERRLDESTERARRIYATEYDRRAASGYPDEDPDEDIDDDYAEVERTADVGGLPTVAEVPR